jgi:hypothetical protein
VGWVLINAVTSQVRTGTNLSGLKTYLALKVVCMDLQPTYGNEKRNRRAFIDSKQVTERFSTE